MVEINVIDYFFVKIRVFPSERFDDTASVEQRNTQGRKQAAKNPASCVPTRVVSSAICRRPLALAAQGVVASLALHDDGCVVMRHLRG